MIRFHLIFLVVLIGIATAQADKPGAPVEWIEQEYPKLLETYHWLHQNPELSFQEVQTAAKIAELWRADGYEVTTKVGGHGIVGVLKNGDGPIVMLRTDLDALPVTEQTQLPYASDRRVDLAGGGTTGVMHACGHDIHMTNLVGTARYLSQHKDLWSGTLMLIGQPAEERGAGARAMLGDGLFTRFPKPDFAVALHCSDDKPAGTVALLAGYALANVDSVDITVKGRGGHGSAPHTTIDPVIQAAELIVSLQTIVSREIKPTEPAVVTVGSIHGGTKHNIIGNDCHLQLTIRSYSDQVRNQILSAIDRKAKAIAQGYGAPEPELSISEGTPSLRNDDQLTARLRKVFIETIGQQNVAGDEPSMGGEDFSQYGRAGVPIVMYRLGTVSQERLDRYEALDVPPPSLHSALYYPDVEPSLRIGIQTMTAAALNLLQN